MDPQKEHSLNKKTNPLDKIDSDKRAFVKKIVVGTAFALPVIKTFSMDEVAAKSIYAARTSF